jgi:GDPmannose 4,6-dehydratase
MKIIVTGVQGQDGSILVEQLVELGHDVVGIGRRRLDDFSLRDLRLINLENKSGRFNYRICDLREASTVHDLISWVKPDVIYNFAAMSSPAESWDNPVGAIGNDTNSVVNILDSIKMHSSKTRLIQACTAAIYHSSKTPINEESPILITNPYAAAKFAAYSICNQYRSRFGIDVSNVIMFNHESIWRPEAFVTRKITKAIAQISAGKQSKLNLWTLSPVRDWGWAEEFMTGVIRIGELDGPSDLILATGVPASISEFVDYCFELVGLESCEFLEINQNGLDTGVDVSVGDASKARSLIGWDPKVTWRGIAERMLEHDINRVRELSSSKQKN